MALLDSKKLVLADPALAVPGRPRDGHAGRAGLKSGALLRRQGERQRAKTTIRS